MAALSVEINLIAGLGNPGAQYEQTRHNAGFWFVDEIARQYGGQFRVESKFNAEICKLSVEGKTIWLMKPQTFMNRSGQPVQALANFYKIPFDQILIAHDELDLDPGTAKLKTGGGHGGHNGLRDLISQLGNKGFQRLRLGIGHPGHKDQVADFVLHRPGKDEQIDIERSIDDALRILPELMAGDWEKAMHKLHSK
ncbi:MAG: aminoacyl-tRNA hydrolase [Gammaproteobacteria bacterium]|nr:aminoacyl-tRNA hydrolase [Gammaproteobacteria bacterium]